jgi:hypothetical protein
VGAVPLLSLLLHANASTQILHEMSAGERKPRAKIRLCTTHLQSGRR